MLRLILGTDTTVTGLTGTDTTALILGTDTTGTDTDLTDTDTGAVLTTVAITTTERGRLSLPSSLPKVAPTPMPRLIPGMDTMVMDTVPMDMDTTDTVLTDMLTGVR